MAVYLVSTFASVKYNILKLKCLLKVMTFNTDLVVDGVELSEDDSVDEVRVLLRGVVRHGRVELDQLVHGLVADQSLAWNKNHFQKFHSRH